MALYAERAALASDPTFLARTRTAAVRYAMYLAAGERNTGAWVLAYSVLTSPDAWARQFALAVSTEPSTLTEADDDPAVDDADGDTALQYSLENRVWPAFASGQAPAA